MLRSRRESKSSKRLSRACGFINEPLESRILFANRIWDGGAGAADPNWSNPVNWQGNNAPVAGDTLFFPATGVSQRTAVNDFDAGTEFLGINIDGSSGYTISGNAIALGSGGIFVDGTASHTLNLPISLANTGRSVTVNDLATLSMSGPFTGSGAMNKNANGRLEITADSPDFSGAVNINAGTLRINSTQALGNTTGQTFVVNFATLIVGVGASGINEQLFLGGDGAAAQGALRAEGTSTWAGAVQLTSNSTTFSVDSGDFTISGNVTKGPSSASLTKQGAGRFILSGSAAQGAHLTVSAGIVRLSGLNPSFGNVVVADAASLEMSGGRTASFNSLSLIGIGGGNGALLNVSGNNTINGPISLAGSATIGSTAGTLTLRGDINTGNANPARTLTIAGAGNVTIGGTGTGAITGNGILTKTGTGTLTLSGSGASTYSGATNVSQGILIARKASALGNTGTGTTVSSGASLRLEANVTVDAEPLTINGAGINNAGALANISGNNTYSGNITLGSAASIGSAAGTLLVTGNIDTTANAHALTTTGAGTVEFGGAGVLSGAGRLIKQGTGTTILSGSGVNTYTGVTEVQNGILQLRKNSALGSTNGDTVTTATGTVQLFSTSSVFDLTPGVIIAEPIRITGAGFQGMGALHNAGGTRNAWSGAVQLINAASVGSAASTLLISGAISGTQALTKVGTAGIALSGNNSAFTGRILIESGSLNARSNNALGASGANSDTRVGNNAVLVLGFSGFQGIGGVNIASESLTLFGAATLRASSALGGDASTWGGPVFINGTAQRFIDAASPLTISGQMSGTAPIVKTGTRDLVLSADTQLTGGMTVNAGRLLVNGTVPGAVTVANGAEVGGTGALGSLTVQSGGVVNPGVNGPGRLTITNGLTMAPNSVLRVEINGTTAGTQHDQIRAGSVTLLAGRTATGNILFPRLEGTLGFNPATGDQFRIIDNVGGTATIGRFSSTSITLGQRQFSIATNGGTGNDVVLTALA